MQLYEMYPHAYSKGNHEYTFYLDDGTKIHYVAGQDGVTEELIEAIKASHRQELLDEDRIHLRRNVQGDKVSKVLSLDAMQTDKEMHQRLLADMSMNPEMIIMDDSAEIAEKVKDCLKHMKPEQRELLEWYYSLNIPLTRIAELRGVSLQAVSKALIAARNSFCKLFVKYG